MIKKLEELKDILMSAKKDNIISPNEISKIQDWIDENDFEFCDSEAGCKILNIIQSILDDATISDKEFEILIQMIEEYNTNYNDKKST